MPVYVDTQLDLAACLSGNEIDRPIELYQGPCQVVIGGLM